MLGLNPVNIIDFLVTSTITVHGGSVVSALDSQAKGRGSYPSCGSVFFPTSIFLSSLSNLCRDRHTHIINTPLMVFPF